VEAADLGPPVERVPRGWNRVRAYALFKKSGTTVQRLWQRARGGRSAVRRRATERRCTVASEARHRWPGST